MRGDKLASGQRSANFSMIPDQAAEPVASGHSRVDVIAPRDAFACRDCDFVGMTAEEFSDHVRSCPVNPVQWNVIKEEVAT